MNRLHVTVGQHQACRDLDFELSTGQSLAILGRNGAGKSTLLNALAGLRQVDSGSISLDQRELSVYPPRELARWRGYCAQHQHDAFPATVLETALIGRHPHLDRWAWESAHDELLAKQALARVGLENFVARHVQTLSGGERQRLALATLLVQDPEWYLLDEPLTYLDLNHVMATLALLQAEVARGKGLIAVLHDPNLARRHFDQALLLFGDGSWEYGAASTVINRDTLQRLYGHPLRSLDDAGESWFVPE
ncbi:MAG TPA: ABC transporter ATP-binding protein [Rhodocyclaceae bacterium]|nr:ABC transporter ATP-binding protein [Rhodocyclaceae bacterium]